MKPKPQELIRVIFSLVLIAFVGCATVKASGPPETWKAVNGGMTRTEIIELIGVPLQGSNQEKDTWTKGGWKLQVEYDHNGRARNIFSQPVGR